METTPAPVMFIHGLWLAASTWLPWVELFESEGYAAVAPLWPGEAATVEETRAHPETQAGNGIAEVAEHFAVEAAKLGTKPIVVGHSFGGLVAQNLVTRGLAVAAVAIDPAQIKGVLPLPLVQLRSALPVLSNPGNVRRAVSLTPAQFRFGFANAVPAKEAGELYDRCTIPSPARPLFQGAVANVVRHSPAAVDTRTGDRGPLLLVTGTRDHTVPAVLTRAAFRLYRHSHAVTELREVPGRGHSLVVDSGWPEVARLTLDWLKDQGFAPA
jgi:pimeloyl-ACP methyl ester carboxylesterase